MPTVLIFYLMISLILLSSAPGLAADRKINLEWESSANAIAYELQLGSAKSNVVLKNLRNLKTARWAGRLSAGQYWMRVRGIDARGLAGPWSEEISFTVKPYVVEPLEPLTGATLISPNETQSVLFKWRAIPKSKLYTLILLDSEGRTLQSYQTKETQGAVTLKTGKKYLWFAQATDEDDQTSQKPESLSELLIKGPLLASPEFLKPDSEFVQSLNLKSNTDPEVTALEIFRWDEKKQDYQLYHQGELRSPQTSFPIPPQWPGGVYKIQAIAKSSYREQSKPSEFSFRLRAGDRSLASEYNQTLRKNKLKLDKPYLTAAYKASPIVYETHLISANRKAALEAITGTAFLGYGFNLSEANIGIHATLELGGILIENKNYIFGGLTVEGVNTLLDSKASLIKWGWGAGLKQLPEVTEINPETVLQNISLVGPQTEILFQRFLSSRWSFQTSLNAFFPLSARSSKGSPLRSLSFYEWGVRIGLQNTQRISSFAGYAYKKQAFAFDDTNTKMGASGISTFDLSGHYLSLGMVYDF